MDTRKIVISESEGYDLERVERLLDTVGISYDVISAGDSIPDEVSELDSSMVLPTMADGAQDQVIEPENMDKLEVRSPFVKAQLSTKNQMILRNIIAILSSLGVVIVFVLEKLGIM